MSQVAVPAPCPLPSGAKLVKILATGPVIDQSGVFHSVFSFDGVVSIGFTACRAMLPDPQFYAECVEASFDDLKKATLGKPKKKKASKTGQSRAANA